MNRIYRHFLDGFDQALGKTGSTSRRIGSELKFPLVNADGSAVDLQTVCELWQHLVKLGWEPVTDRVTGSVVGATKPGPQNPTVASCETGFCKTEFSLAHVADLFELARAIDELRSEIQPFWEARNIRFLGYGIHPVTPPGRHLLLKKERSCFWDRAVPSNRVIPRGDGDDVHMFTINAGSHVHVGVLPQEAVKAVNVLCGFSAGQIALTAHSNVWRGRTDGYKSVAEMLWDWWKPAEGRCGLPPRPFDGLEDYVDTISGLRPIYVKRDGRPVVLDSYTSFADYFGCCEASGRDLEGQKQPLVPETCDIDLHNSCYWYTARISRYFTVENRVFDQQPPEDLLCTAALTLGLVSALDEAWEEVSSFDWNDLRKGRERACREGLSGAVDSTSLVDFGSRMLDVAGRGLENRGRGEAQFLEPLKSRLAAERCPADDVADLFCEGGVAAVVEARAL